jgi:hypothetical protein
LEGVVAGLHVVRNQEGGKIQAASLRYGYRLRPAAACSLLTYCFALNSDRHRELLPISIWIYYSMPNRVADQVCGSAQIEFLFDVLAMYLGSFRTDAKAFRDFLAGRALTE